MLPYDSKCVHIMLSSKGMKILYCESQWLSIIHSIAMHLKLKNSDGCTQFPFEFTHCYDE